MSEAETSLVRQRLTTAQITTAIAVAIVLLTAGYLIVRTR